MQQKKARAEAPAFSSELLPRVLVEGKGVEAHAEHTTSNHQSTRPQVQASGRCEAHDQFAHDNHHVEQDGKRPCTPVAHPGDDLDRLLAVFQAHRQPARTQHASEHRE